MVISGLWTSMCFAYTALHAIREGYEVYGLMDAAGDSTPDAHRYGIERMLQAGVIPITTEALVSEWMHDWGNPKSMVPDKRGVFEIRRPDRSWDAVRKSIRPGALTLAGIFPAVFGQGAPGSDFHALFLFPMLSAISLITDR